MWKRIFMKPIRVTVLGSCRQDSVRDIDIFKCTDLQKEITYAHYSKEVIEMIKFCKYGHLTPEETRYCLRSAMLYKKPIIFNNHIKSQFEQTDIFLVEIASKLTYEYNGKYLHHIAEDPKYNVHEEIRNNITSREQSKKEIEQDILQIKELLSPKKVIIITHFASYKRGKRYELTQWLEEICEKHSIPIINPAKRLSGYSPAKLFKNEQVLSHYTYEGHNLIRQIYKKDIIKVLKRA